MFSPTPWEPTARERRTVLHDPNGKILTLDWAADGELARSVVTRSRARMTGKLPSWKLRRMVQWESRPERYAMILLDACPAVLAYREQPLEVRFRLGGEDHVHFPDLLVQFANVRELWEVKTRKDATEPFVAARTQLMMAELPKWNLAYRIMIAEDLARQPRLSLARDLLRFGRSNVDSLARERVRAILERVEFVTWGSALAGHLGKFGRNALCRLTLEGRLLCESHGALAPASTFRWA